jgi:hypothetical protein
MEKSSVFENVAGLDEAFGLESVGLDVREVTPTRLSGDVVRG